MRAAGKSYAPSVTSTTSQDLDANIPETGTVASTDDEPKDLWDRAYTALRKRGDLKKIMNTYEKVLLENIQGEDSSTGTFASLKASEREEQMSALVQKKVDDMEEKKTILRLGGKEMEFRPQFDRVVKGVVYAKDFVTLAVSVDPHAALAWAGVCIFLPVSLPQPSPQHASSLLPWALQRLCVNTVDELHNLVAHGFWTCYMLTSTCPATLKSFQTAQSS